MRPMKKIWFDGRLVDWDSARVHVLTHALHYGYAVFEGIRCHTTPQGPAIFRLDEHLERFAQSAKIYRMKLPFSVAQLHDACVALVQANGVPQVYIRPVAFSSYGEMGLDPTVCKIQAAIGMWEWGAYLGAAGAEEGVRATVSSWVRVDSRSLPPQAKCAANYANAALAKMEATAGGYDEAILKVKNGVVSTPPASSGILRGITRDTIIRFVAEEGWTFHRMDFTREEMFAADEVFYTGTAAGVTPIREIDGRPIGGGKFPVTRRLQALYEDALHGRDGRHAKWLTYVNP
ncbi:MAG: branched-chain amino acid transaminase [Thermoplasmata archaeon]|nr:branched-chain amino acid transaminase [Thermoplasmata archaeon]